MVFASHLEPFVILDRTQTPDYLNTLLVGHCDDCACTNPSPIFPPVGSTSRRIQPDASVCQTDQLHVEKIEGSDFWAIFNPTGDQGVVVLDNQAVDLLEKFRNPLQLDIVGQAYGSYSDEAVKAGQRLFELGLLREPDESGTSPAHQSNKILTAWLHVTNQCNLDCLYCYVNKTNEHMSEQVGREAIDAILRSSAGGGYPSIRLKYAGGEASLCLETVFRLHDYAEKRCRTESIELQAVLLTNGVGLQSSSINGLKQRQIEVMISLDGVDASHDSQRPFRGGQGSVGRVIESIECLISHDLRPHLSITVTGRNALHIANVVKYALTNNLTFSINFFRENDVALSRADLNLGEAKVIAGMIEVFETIEANLPQWSVVGAILDRGQLISPHDRVCDAGLDYMVIKHNGNISKCHMEMNRGVATIYDRNPLEKIRLSPIGLQNVSSLDKEDCRDCEWRYFCAGGCPLTTFRATGRYDVKSPNCNIYRTIFPWAVRLEGKRILQYAQ